MAKSKCDNCVYSGCLGYSHMRVCNYLLVTNKRRPCPPGDACTVNVPRKVKRKKKKGAENGKE